MPDQTMIIVGLALAAISVTAIFLLVVLVAAVRRARGLSVGPRLSATLALTGGLAIGTYLPLSSDLITIAPILAAGLILIVGQWRRGRRVLAGWVLADLALPWAILWGAYVAALTFAHADFEPVSTWVTSGSALS
jgi:hypothetical protein